MSIWTCFCSVPYNGLGELTGRRMDESDVSHKQLLMFLCFTLTLLCSHSLSSRLLCLLVTLFFLFIASALSLIYLYATVGNKYVLFTILKRIACRAFIQIYLLLRPASWLVRDKSDAVCRQNSTAVSIRERWSLECTEGLRTLLKGPTAASMVAKHRTFWSITQHPNHPNLASFNAFKYVLFTKLPDIYRLSHYKTIRLWHWSSKQSNI